MEPLLTCLHLRKKLANKRYVIYEEVEMRQERLVLKGEHNTGLSCGQMRLFLVSITFTVAESCPESSPLLLSPTVGIWRLTCFSLS